MRLLEILLHRHRAPPAPTEAAHRAVEAVVGGEDLERPGILESLRHGTLPFARWRSLQPPTPPRPPIYLF